MGVKPEQQQMQQLLTEAITVLCKNGLQYRSHFNVEGLLGITLDDEDVFLVSIKQTVKGDLVDPSLQINVRKNLDQATAQQQKSPMSRAKQRKKRKRSTDSIERLASNSIPLHNNNNTEKVNSNNVPYAQKSNGPLAAMHPEWENKKDTVKSEDYFDDNASSPGEVIVVKAESLDSLQEGGSHDPIYNNPNKSSSQAHSSPSSQQFRTSPAPESIYASSNGQIALGGGKEKENGKKGDRVGAYNNWDPTATYSEARKTSDQPAQGAFLNQIRKIILKKDNWSRRGRRWKRSWWS